MAKQARPNMQDVFNEIATTSDIPTLVTVLNKIDLLKVKDKKEILNKLEAVIITALIETGPILQDVQSDLENITETGMAGPNKEMEEALLKPFQAAFLVSNKIVEGKQGKAEPILRDLMENVSKLSDREYNDLATVMTSVARTIEPYKNKKNLNPFKK